MCKDSDDTQCRLGLEEFEDVESVDGIDNLRAEYLAAKLATERERCKFLEIRVQRARSELIPADEVKKAMFVKGRIIRDGILNIPDRIAPLLLNKSSVSEIHTVLMHELREVLKELSQDDQRH